MQTRIYWIQVIAAALAGGAALAAVHMPAAWFLGPMIGAGIVTSLHRRTLHLPEHVSLVGMAMLGGAVSTALTPAALTVVIDYWLIIVLTIGALLVFSIISGILLARLSSLDLPTALLGMMPGGAPGMMALSEELGGDARMVAIMQILRVMLVMATLTIVTALVVPLGGGAAPSARLPSGAAADWHSYLVTLGITVLGAWSGLRLQLPAGALTGPAVLGALLGLVGITHAPWPGPLLALSYAVIGLSIGLQFSVHTFRQVGRLLPAFLLTSLILIGSGALIGWIMTLLTSIDPFSAYLATTPGGLNVVTIIALDSDASVTIVLTINLLRFLVIMLAGRALVRQVMRLLHAEAAPSPGAS